MINENELIPYQATKLPQGPYLLFAPHPDDETLGMGGTIIRATRDGILVHVVFMTCGEMGGDPRVRREESLRAADILGVSRRYFLNLMDRKVGESQCPEGQLQTILNECEPKTLFLPSFQEIHPDHRATTRMILSLLKKSGIDIPLWFYEINRQGEINHLVDITAVIEIKKRAIACYESQLDQLDYESHSLSLNRTRSITLGEASLYSEGFWVQEHVNNHDAEAAYAEHLSKYLVTPLVTRNSDPVRPHDTIKHENPVSNKRKDFQINTHGLRPTTNHESFDMAMPINSFQIKVKNDARQIRRMKERIKHQDMTLKRYVALNGQLAKAVNETHDVLHQIIRENEVIQQRTAALEKECAQVAQARSHQLASAYIQIGLRLRYHMTRMPWVLLTKVKGWVKCIDPRGRCKKGDKRDGITPIVRGFDDHMGNRDAGEGDGEMLNFEEIMIESHLFPALELLDHQTFQMKNRELNLHDERLVHGVTRVIDVPLSHRIAFPVTAHCQNLAAIRLFMATYQRINPGTLIMDLYNGTAPHQWLRRCEVPVPSILDNAFLTLPFDPIEASEKCRYLVTLMITGGKPEMPVAVWAHAHDHSTPFETYQAWIAANEKNEKAIEDGERRSQITSSSEMKDRNPNVAFPPCCDGLHAYDDELFLIGISVVFPLHIKGGSDFPTEEMIHQSVNSLICQTCDQWQLIILYDPETDCPDRTLLDRWGDESRILFISSSCQQKPETALTLALDHASGDFVTFLYPADTLAPNAVSECLTLLASRPDTHVVYSDEDWISRDNVRMDPFFKPDWSPDLLLAFSGYPGGMTLFRTSVLQKAGEFTEGCATCASYDGILRVVDQLSSDSPPSSGLSTPILHLPKILYHRRTRRNSPLGPSSGHETSQSVFFHESLFLGNGDMGDAKKAVVASLGRRGEGEYVNDGLTPTSFHTVRPLTSKPKVSIIIPFRDAPEVLETAIQSIIQRSSYTHYEMVCVDNQSAHPETFSLMDRLDAMPEVTLIHDDLPFNFSALNNRAVKHATGEVLLFLNSDVEVISENWLEAMLIHACREAVGAVGARLLYANDTLQHGGIVLGVAGLAGHAFKHLPNNDRFNYPGLPFMVRNVSAVTGACLMIRRGVFDAVGGFDEEKFSISYNDLDLCLKLRKRGYLNIYTPFAELYHYESYSRGYAYDEKATCEIQKKWGALLESDPYYNPNLTTTKEDWGINLYEPV